MFRRIARIEKILEEFAKETTSKLHDIDKTIVKQEENLKEHMRRTEVAERRLDNIETDLKPIKIHIARLDGVTKFLGLIALLVGIGVGLTKFLSFII